MDCIFCKIAAGEIAAKTVAETAKTIAFWDISPRQPIHVLLVPKIHYENIAELSTGSPEHLVDLMQLGAKVAEELSTGSFRFTFNTGVEAGQSVFHVHGHITSTTPKA